MTTPSKSPSEDGFLVKNVVVTNRFGIHARPAALIVKAASGFDCEVFIEKDGMRINAKSIMGLLTLEGAHGSELVLFARGHDAPQALDAILDLFAKNFFED